MAEKKQLVVLGGGPGGYPAAYYAADHGMDVTIINMEENPGGVCLYRGCIPSKALLHVAKLLNEVEHAKECGITFGKPKINLNKLRSFKEDVVQKLTGGLGGMNKARNVKYIQGYGTFKDANTIEVKKADGSTEDVSFETCIIAAGSHPTKIPGLSIDSPRVMDSRSALELVDIPGKLMILGGGYIGLEMGAVYNALGSKVTVVEMMNQILPGADKDLVVHLARRLDHDLEDIKLKTKVVALKEQKNGIKVTLEDSKGEQKHQLFDKVLISVGRRPNSKIIGLENTGVETDERGFITVDPQRRTNVPHLYAIGDIAGDPMLAHKATAEGKVAVEAILGKKTIFEPAAIPCVVFTDPEIAWAGLTETEAKEQKIAVKVAKFPWAASGRATTIGRSDGLTKLIVHPETDQILGMAICGPGAGELIAEGVLAIEMGANVEDLALTIHPHPTLSETVMEAAEVYHGHSPHYFQPKRKK